MRWVTRCSARQTARPSPASWWLSGMISVPPAAKVGMDSPMATSNPGEAWCRTRLPESMANRSTWEAVMAAIPSWVTTVPFGCPVEPEV